jgi:hypothetical protein
MDVVYRGSLENYHAHRFDVFYKMSISSMYKAPLSFSDVLTPVGAEREWTADGNSTSGDSEVELSINKNLFEVSGTGYQLTQEQIDLFCSATKKLLMPNTTSWGELEELEEELVAAGSDERFFVLALETGTFPCYVWDRDDSSTSVMLLSHYTEFNGESLSLFYRGNCRFYNTMTGNGTRLPMIMFFYDEQGRTENGEDVVEYHPGNYEVPVCIVYGIRRSVL